MSCPSVSPVPRQSVASRLLPLAMLAVEHVLELTKTAALPVTKWTRSHGRTTRLSILGGALTEAMRRLCIARRMVKPRAM
mmetsp:Transcript_3444/g.13323  ORF Transcript_3444/g.13323 Transcript_3444/m.13323 type:complete len:80 (-) Transcript_3444:3298-3537(-)